MCTALLCCAWMCLCFVVMSSIGSRSRSLKTKCLIDLDDERDILIVLSLGHVELR